MKEINNLVLAANNSYCELETLESIIELTKKYCLYNELDSIYYNLASIEKLALSEERNHYINLLTIAIEKISSLKLKCQELEDFVAKLH